MTFLGRPHREGFDAAYTHGTAPWDIGRPQPAIAAAAAGGLRGPVLDVGCGTGEHALMAAAQGLPATGVDIAPTAVAIATRKAQQRGLAATFAVGDVLDLEALGGTYGTALDCGLFHILTDDERPVFAASLGAVLRPEGRYHMLCFSEREPGDWGPRRVRQEEIHATFRAGWRVDAIDAARLELSEGRLGLPEGRLGLSEERRSAAGWLATVTRL